MGPALYSLYSADLIREVAGLGVKIMAFADDILIITNERAKLFKALNTILKWCECNNSEVNKAKSGILISKLDGRTRNPPQSHLRGIPIVSSYKYLGITVSNTFNVM
jgi:hypothetical protein